MRFELTIALLIAGMLLLLTGFQPASASIRLKSGIEIQRSATVKKAVYRLSDSGDGMIIVTGHNLTIDFNGAQILGNGKGIGIHISNASNVLIKNVSVSSCKWGVAVEHSDHIRIEGCNISRNRDLPPGTIIDESGREPQDNNGGGILLRDSQNCLIRYVTAQHQWDGIDLVRSDSNVIEDSDFSYCNNWGVHFWLSSKNTFQRNRAIWCTTGEGKLWQALTGWQTYDSAAVLIEHASNDNTIRDCDLRYGGDGLFIRANEGPVTPGTTVPPLHASNGNRVINCDCSFSPNNAIEADLCDNNVFIGNNCSNSHYGFWLGLSRWNQVIGNIVMNNTTRGMEIEAGQHDLIKDNIFGNSHDPNQIQILLRRTGRDNTPSGPYTIHNNLFVNSRRPIYLSDTPATITGNRDYVGSLAQFQFIQADPNSPTIQQHNEIITKHGRTMKISIERITPAPSGIGWLVTLKGIHLSSVEIPPLIEVEAIPAQVTQWNENTVTFWLPMDLWNLPYRSRVEVRVWTADGINDSIKVPYRVPRGLPIITEIAPNPAPLGATVEVKGRNLVARNGKANVSLNGNPADILDTTAGRITLKAPAHRLSSVSFNLIVRSGKWESWPMPIAVDVPADKVPHIIAAHFSPTVLKVGDRLKVEFTVKNSADFALEPRQPGDGFTYDEDKTFYDLGYQEVPGSIYLRVDSERTGGSWPYFWGLSHPLEPGQTATITGYIKMEHAGKMIWRIGMVDAGIRWIDDNMYRTEIRVEPK